MSSQQLVGAAGIGLVIANAWTGRQRKDLAPIFDSSFPREADNLSKRAAKEIGAELLAVGVLVLLAGGSAAASGAALAVIAALWLVFLLHRTPTT